MLSLINTRTHKNWLRTSYKKWTGTSNILNALKLFPFCCCVNEPQHLVLYLNRTMKPGTTVYRSGTRYSYSSACVCARNRLIQHIICQFHQSNWQKPNIACRVAAKMKAVASTSPSLAHTHTHNLTKTLKLFIISFRIGWWSRTIKTRHFCFNLMNIKRNTHTHALGKKKPYWW